MHHSVDAVFQFAQTMTWKGNNPVVRLVTTTYQTGVKLTNKAMHELINEPPTEQDIQLQPQWAAFCAAAVEELCIRTSFPCPAWVNQSVYFLKEPWILPSAPTQPDAQMLQPFQRRNILVGNSVLNNKYELKYKYPQQASKFTPGQKKRFSV